VPRRDGDAGGGVRHRSSPRHRLIYYLFIFIPGADHAAGIPERPDGLPHGQLSPVPRQQRPETGRRFTGETGTFLRRRRDHQPPEREELPEPPEQPQPPGKLHLTPARAGRDPFPGRNRSAFSYRARRGRRRSPVELEAAPWETEPGDFAAAFQTG